ncbi:major facilitator superfamily domain-containing protein 4A-like [Babylonia areolata]|uniref:major facilitator superfamily domain-containing protein 4A-like n=1 Tax=Babylonia areolata TaxID=304850 RepID=UPI003FD25BCF
MTDTNPPPHPSRAPADAADDSKDPVEMADSSDWPVTRTTINSGEPERLSFWKLFLDNRLYVLTYCFVFGSFGVCVGFLGPTVFDLGCQTSSDQKEMNWVFFVQLLMSLVGSISAGCLADSVPNHMLMLGAAVGVSLAMFIIPACTNLASLLSVLILMGWCMGCLDCLANMRMILLFGKCVSPFLQAMHCFYGVGAFVSPMIASAFLLNKDCSPYIDGFTTETPVDESPVQRASSPRHNDSAPVTTVKLTLRVGPQPQQVFRYKHLSHVPQAFFILGSMQLAIAFLVAYVIFLEKFRGLRPRSVTSDNPELHSGHVTPPPARGLSAAGFRQWLRDALTSCGPRETVTVTVFTCILLFLFDGLQSSFANYIYTYAHDSHLEGLHKYEGAVLDSCFWGLFALGRMIAVPLAARLTAAFMLLVNITGCSLALLLTLIFRRSHVMMYVGTCSVGLFVSSLSPTAISMGEQFIDINPTIATCLVVAAALGEALCPIIVGNLVVSMGPSSFLVFCVTFSLLALLLYGVLLWGGRQTPKSKAFKNSSFVWLNGQTWRQEGENTVIRPASVKYYSRMDEEGEPYPDPAPPSVAKDGNHHPRGAADKAE